MLQSNKSLSSKNNFMAFNHTQNNIQQQAGKKSKKKEKKKKINLKN